ncbi:MAG TPA: hypothetical protein VI873_02435 [Candidatus Peribacteraceae bacterium]|nr:hypothetical protein [Candidatus Peribacteraceae bacterium]
MHSPEKRVSAPTQNTPRTVGLALATFGAMLAQACNKVEATEPKKPTATELLELTEAERAGDSLKREHEKYEADASRADEHFRDITSKVDKKWLERITKGAVADSKVLECRNALKDKKKEIIDDCIRLYRTDEFQKEHEPPKELIFAKFGRWESESMRDAVSEMMYKMLLQTLRPEPANP